MKAEQRVFQLSVFRWAKPGPPDFPRVSLTVFQLALESCPVKDSRRVLLSRFQLALVFRSAKVERSDSQRVLLFPFQSASEFRSAKAEA